jgi:hypothetical protein
MESLRSAATIDSRWLRLERNLRRTPPSAVSTFNLRSLTAFEIALTGNRRRAGEELAELERSCANRFSCGLDNYDIAIHHLAAATAGTEVTAGLAYLEMAKLEDARGDPGVAAEYYRQFLRRYDRPMPAQQHIVHQAEVALTRLQHRN